MKANADFEAFMAKRDAESQAAFELKRFEEAVK